ncbi:MAG: cytochrome c3 family protein [Bacillota bacterium]
MSAETEKNIETGTPPAFKRYNTALVLLGVLCVVLFAGLLYIWPFGLAAREKTAEQWLKEGLDAFEKQNFFLADRAFKEALRLAPRDGDAPYYLGQLYDSCGRRREAVMWYTRAALNEPALAAANFNLGLLYGLQRAPEMEITAQMQAVQTNPAFAAAWFRLGEVYYLQGQWEDAAKAYRAAGRNPHAVLDRKLIEERLGELENRLSAGLPEGAAGKTAPPREPLGSDILCTRCHTGVAGTHRLTGENTNGCIRCHAPHNPLYPPRLKIPEKSRCQVCHFEYSPDAVKFARKEGSFVHMPLVNGNCTDCHTEHALGEKAKLRQGQRVLCFSCHPDYRGELKRPVQHPPYNNSYCTDCHNPHISKYTGLLRGPQNRMCYNCHFAFSNVTRLPVQHSPFEKGFCTSCHEPHAANYKALLRLNQLRLCYSCHFDRNADLLKPVKHKPYAEGRCTDCHDPHAARTKGLLPAPSQTEFCLKCHSRQYVFGPEHHPVPEGLLCIACHSPHAGYEKALLPRKSADLCTGCHDFDYYKRGKHGKLSCLDCHGMEGFGFRFETPAEKLRACLHCHPGYIGEKARRGKKTCYLHPVGPPWTDANAGGLLTCSSTCHNPHGTPYRCLLTGKGDGLCLKCHKEKGSRR